ncbi:MAG TPA: hypothetical protein VGD50_00725, partial [Candidatus Baltobacteraceae bacterium]
YSAHRKAQRDGRGWLVSVGYAGQIGSAGATFRSESLGQPIFQFSLRTTILFAEKQNLGPAQFLWFFFHMAFDHAASSVRYNSAHAINLDSSSRR